MARKSNKTAHVLNLLSGQDTTEEPEKTPEQQGESKEEAKTEAPKAEPAETIPTPEVVPAAHQTVSPEVPSNISIIDSGAKEDDLVAERIHEELLKELGMEDNIKPEAPVAPAAEESKVESPSVSPAAEEPKAESLPVSPVTEESKAETPPASPVTEEPKAETPPVSSVTEEPKAETPPVSPAVEEPEEELLELAPEPPAEPEPDYVMLNVMQRVVEDKIIYFMKQFEVCTCDRCIADTIALTLSGLPAKYRIVDKHAVDPLVSYYTSRLISQVTVEALKACTQVKDNPRH